MMVVSGTSICTDHSIPCYSDPRRIQLFKILCSMGTMLEHDSK